MLLTVGFAFCTVANRACGKHSTLACHHYRVRASRHVFALSPTADASSPRDRISSTIDCGTDRRSISPASIPRTAEATHHVWLSTSAATIDGHGLRRRNGWLRSDATSTDGVLWPTASIWRWTARYDGSRDTATADRVLRWKYAAARRVRWSTTGLLLIVRAVPLAIQTYAKSTRIRARRLGNSLTDPFRIQISH